MSESPQSELSFRDAMNELREILENLEEEEVDLDALSGMVARAAELVKYCRRKIIATEMQVRQVIDELHADLESMDEG